MNQIKRLKNNCTNKKIIDHLGVGKVHLHQANISGSIVKISEKIFWFTENIEKIV